jgi:outer membrane immunogenic protein
MMQKVLLGTVATILIAGSASAADLAVKAPPQAPAFMASPWDGPYIGGNVGFGSTDFKATASVLGVSAADSVTGSGVVGGVQVGYNKQFGTFVLGLETDFDGTSISNTTDAVSTKLSWFGTTRVRAGFLLTPALLFYGTGGVAYGHVEQSGFGASVTTPGVGWAAGAGLQYALTPQWSIGAEYLHVDLDTGSAHENILGISASVSSKATTDLGRATLNYKF